MVAILASCPGCGAPLAPDGTCQSCGATVRGVYQGLDLGTLELARAVEQGLDYYLILGVPATADADTIKNAAWERRRHLPPANARMHPEQARRVELCEQASTVLRDPQRRALYDRLRRQRDRYYAQRMPTHDTATRGARALQSGQFDEAARLLQQAHRHQPADGATTLQYVLALLYGSSNLASPEDWRVDAMQAAVATTLQHTPNDPQLVACGHLLAALHAYDQQQFTVGWRQLVALTEQHPAWHLPWLVGAFWYRREGKHATALAFGERARRLLPNDPLIRQLHTHFQNLWATVPATRTSTLQHAARVLRDGTTAHDLQEVWR